MRTLADLRDVCDPAWPELAEAICDADAAEALTVDPTSGERCLLALQATARSTLGALALNTGGMLVDQGWLRVLGGGAAGLPSLAQANRLRAETGVEPPEVLFVAFDVIGGRFAVNGGGLQGEMGEIHYWAPDTLRWEALGIGHSEFVRWAFGAGVGEFYADLRWAGWDDEIKHVRLDQGISFYPPLCTAESRPPNQASRRTVPWIELAAVLDELAAAPNGPIRIVFDD